MGKKSASIRRSKSWSQNLGKGGLRCVKKGIVRGRARPSSAAGEKRRSQRKKKKKGSKVGESVAATRGRHHLGNFLPGGREEECSASFLKEEKVKRSGGGKFGGGKRGVGSRFAAQNLGNTSSPIASLLFHLSKKEHLERNYLKKSEVVQRAVTGADCGGVVHQLGEPAKGKSRSQSIEVTFTKFPPSTQRSRPARRGSRG